jgi:hypothetical protein
MTRTHLLVWTIIFTISAGLPELVRGEQKDKIERGFEIAPVPLNLVNKDPNLVGFGSYLVNTMGCNDCHTHPNWAGGGNPFLGQIEQINVTQYLSGGRVFSTPFGPVISRNLTPDETENPAGLTLPEFISVMRTGRRPGAPAEALLKIMPWPLYRWNTDGDLAAMYEYLRAVPSLPNNPEPGP